MKALLIILAFLIFFCSNYFSYYNGYKQGSKCKNDTIVIISKDTLFNNNKYLRIKF